MDSSHLYFLRRHLSHACAARGLLSLRGGLFSPSVVDVVAAPFGGNDDGLSSLFIIIVACEGSTSVAWAGPR
jgi:hypothetical protein